MSLVPSACLANPFGATPLEQMIPPLRRYARALVRDSSSADDLVQDCLEHALSRAHLWEQGTDLRAWLFAAIKLITPAFPIAGSVFGSCGSFVASDFSVASPTVNQLGLSFVPRHIKVPLIRKPGA